ncbi:hypothetical protein [Synechococcus sp. NB0720_010]|uniref:hypothetical protein n=1 Tax=Synechococcus sp. NB0720_010 TaxID=2907159 RepID=UPI001FF737D7|nr:hypothetical protein [Synechococcus sp. NB0720_010]UPH89320.1 hypothetical protein LY254_08445 [Synechococcus sp. NB0720_010]
MPSEDKGLASFRKLVADNPHKGTAGQVVALALGISEAGDRLSLGTFALYREASGLGDKVFSKLKVIGDRLGRLDDKTRGEVIKGLPPSYSAIYYLSCALTPEELATAVKKKQVTPKTSVRTATAYVKQVRYPRQAVSSSGVEKGRWSVKEDPLYRVCRPEDTTLSEDLQRSLERDLRKLCGQYGLVVRQATNESTTALRDAERRERAAFWRQVLEEQLPQKWFEETSQEVRKTFNLKVVEEVWDAPLRTFTGFLIRTGQGREHFYEDHGQAYVAKLHYLQETTESRSNRYYLKERVEEVLGHDKGKKLAIWRNVVLKNSGLL